MLHLLSMMMMCGGGSWQGYATEACMRPDCGNTTTGKLLITQIVFQDVGQMLHIGKYDWYFKRLMPNVPLFDPSWQTSDDFHRQIQQVVYKKGFMKGGVQLIKKGLLQLCRIGETLVSAKFTILQSPPCLLQDQT